MTSYRRSAAAILLGAAALTTACRDESPPVAPGAAPSLSTGANAPESGTVTFIVPPDKGLAQNIGDHKIKFSKGAICDPALSSYGTGEWDQPCTAATVPVQITAYYWKDRGHPRIDFYPALRFNPKAKVYLYLMDKSLSQDPSERHIAWVDSTGAVIDESLTDPEVATYVGKNDYLYRRIKHFSGYLIASGRSYDGYDGATTSTTTY